jgi:general secretion pathway protein F/type IV pilus assembly protein PilC
MKELFEDRALHPITALVLGVSQFVNAHAIFLALSASTLLAGAIVSLRTKKSKLFLYAWSLKLPFVKTLLLDSALVRFCRSLSMLLSGGVPLLEALELSRGVVKNPLLEASILSAEKRIGQGERLSGAFRGEPLIPPLVIRMLSLSEETGRMEDAFFSLAGIYDEEMEKHLSQLTTFLQPALLIALGVIVGLVVLSILLPLTDVSSFTS